MTTQQAINEATIEHMIGECRTDEQREALARLLITNAIALLDELSNGSDNYHLASELANAGARLLDGIKHLNSN